jgi:hypothetical protein
MPRSRNAADSEPKMVMVTVLYDEIGYTQPGDDRPTFAPKGAEVELTEDEFVRLTAANLIRGPAVEKAGSKRKGGAATSEEATGTAGAQALEDMEIEQLMATANDKGVTVESDDTQASLIKKLHAAGVE